jgi:hypothetical protein
MDFIVPSQVLGTVGTPLPGPPTRIRQTAVTVGPATTQVVAADPARRGVVIKNTDAAAGAVIGDATVTWAVPAFLLGAGESITLAGIEAVFGDSNAGVVLSVLEELV